MAQPSPKIPHAETSPAEPKTFTSPPMLGTRELWALVLSLVEALPPEQVQKPRVDLQVAAESALSVCDDVRNDPVLYGRFVQLAKIGEFKEDGFRELQRLAGAAWYARRMQRLAESSDSEATVPVALVADGEALIGRMLHVTDYYLGAQPEVASVLSTINLVAGHRRLANNLHNLADLYEAHRDVIAHDTVHYRASDARDARKTASAIVAALADDSTGESERWGDRCARIWTLFSASYAEVQEAGQFLLRKTPEEAKARFPSLVAEARAESPLRPR